MSSLQKRLIKNKQLKSYKKLQIALRKAKQKPGAPALWMYCYEELEKRSPWPPRLGVRWSKTKSEVLSNPAYVH